MSAALVAATAAAEPDGEMEVEIEEHQEQHPHQQQPVTANSANGRYGSGTSTSVNGRARQMKAAIATTRQNPSAVSNTPRLQMSQSSAVTVSHTTPSPLTASSLPLCFSSMTSTSITPLHSHSHNHSHSHSRTPSPTHLSQLDSVALARMLSEMEQQRERYTEQQQYALAEKAHKAVEKIKKQLERRRASNLEARHAAELSDMQRAHEAELEEWVQTYVADGSQLQAGPTATGLSSVESAEQQRTDRHASILASFDADTERRRQSLLMQHIEELEVWTRKEQERLACRPKFSRRLHQLRTAQHNHARMKQYTLAEEMKLEADTLEAIELERMRAEWLSKVQRRRTQFLQEQQRVMRAFIQRRQSEREVLLRKLSMDLQSTIIQKYENLRGELRTLQMKEKKKLEMMRVNGNGNAIHQLHLETGLEEGSILEAKLRTMREGGVPGSKRTTTTRSLEHKLDPSLSRAKPAPVRIGRFHMASSATVARKQQQHKQPTAAAGKSQPTTPYSYSATSRQGDDDVDDVPPLHFTTPSSAPSSSPQYHQAHHSQPASARTVTVTRTTPSSARPAPRSPSSLPLPSSSSLIRGRAHARVRTRTHAPLTARLPQRVNNRYVPFPPSSAITQSSSLSSSRSY